MSITDRQKKIVDFIKSYQLRNGFSPTVREICHGVGLASPGSLMKHLDSLEREGLISKVASKKRSWKVVGTDRLTIPIIGRIAAGFPILAQENREDELAVDPKIFGVQEAFALKVRGDSMIGVYIRDGDLAVIQPRDHAENGDIVAALVEELETEATLKILRFQNGDLELHPANENYSVLRFKGEEIKKVRIIGKMIGVIRPVLGKVSLFKEA
jgi:repressor LexA